MKTLVVVLLAGLLASCATRGTDYRRLPEQYRHIDPATRADTFVFEFIPPFQDPHGYRFEFFEGNRPQAVKTTYSYRGLPQRKTLSAGQSKRIKAALLAFDWNRAVNPKDPDVKILHCDDLEVFVRARIRGIDHEVQIGLSDSDEIKRLINETEVFQ